jgi:tetratricopeptide (TPR) repeat protein
MTAPIRKPPGMGGGSIATRGLLVQTLVALLDVVQADPPFTEITLEPAFGDEQFDFVWKDHANTHATQVKSTTILFKRPDVEKWARKLETARSTEHCRLMLVGNCHSALERVVRVGKVELQKKALDLPGLFDQAAHRVAKFIHAENLDAGTPDEHEKIAKALVTELELYATESRTLTRAAFIKLLRQWVITAPRQERRFDISHFDVHKYAPAQLIGREAETKLLNDTWAKVRNAESPRPHILTFVALGGEGKTALVAKWAAELAGQDWPGCDAAFAWSFYSQGTRDQAAVSSDTFLKDALTFFGDAAMAGSTQGAFDKGRRLAQLVGERRALLILDGLEPLQYAPTSPTPGELKDSGLAALLKGLAASSRGLCIVTTRYSIPDLKAYWQTTAPEEKLLRLSREAGVHLLQRLGVKGSLRKNIPDAGGQELLNEFEKVVEDVKGHALTLNLLGAYLHDAHAGDIRKCDLVKLEEADSEEQGGHAFHVMDAYVRWFESEGEKGQRALVILRLLGLFDRPATSDCLNALWKGEAIAGLTEPLMGMSDAQRNVALTRLEAAKLLTVRRDAAGTLLSLDAHPLIRQYFGQRLRKQPDAWQAAHRRLYEHLCNTTSDKKPNPTLEDLQPLYQAVAHGCQAGLHQETCDEVYVARILRGNEFYSKDKLGAWGSDLGAIACFFEAPWRRPSGALRESDQAWLLNEAGHTLRALGRLTEALEPMRATMEINAAKSQWKNAAVCAVNLSELELPLGKVAGAVGDAERSVTHADLGGDASWRMVTRTAYADALHQTGCRAEAEAHFREAEQMQAARRPQYPLLCSLEGFTYCDLLLATSERAAWQFILQLKAQNADFKTLVGSCRAVSQRAAQTREWGDVAYRQSLLDIALDHLTVGRAALYQAILEKSAIRNPPSEIEEAVDALRRAGTQHIIPLGLLTLAWLRSLEGDAHGAQADLDEAWEIAERGPMKLFVADIHLYRARLFGPRKAEAKYPWESPQADLAAARKLINECGYHRRDEELADAEEAAKGW